MKLLALLLDNRFYAVLFQSYYFLDRRQYLDMVGFLPTDKELRQFTILVVEEIKHLALKYCDVIQQNSLTTMKNGRIRRDIPPEVIDFFNRVKKLDVANINSFYLRLRACETRMPYLRLRNPKHRASFNLRRRLILDDLNDEINTVYNRIIDGVRYSRLQTSLERRWKGIKHVYDTIVFDK